MTKFNDLENTIRKAKDSDARYAAFQDACVELAHYFAKANTQPAAVCRSMIQRAVQFWNHLCKTYQVMETETEILGMDEAYFGTCIVAICGKNAIPLLKNVGLTYNASMLDECISLCYPEKQSSKMFLIGVH